MAQPRPPVAVTLSTASNRPVEQFPTALDYLRDLIPGSLPRSIEDCLKNDVELNYWLPIAWLTAHPKRQLEFRATITPSDHKSYGTRHLWINIGALLVYITGFEKTERCGVKPGGDECKKKFARCIVPLDGVEYDQDFKGAKRTACANHQYDAEWSRCTLRGEMIRLDGQSTAAQAADSVADDAQSAVAQAAVAGSQVAGTQPADQQTTPNHQTPAHRNPRCGTPRTDGSGRGGSSRGRSSRSKLPVSMETHDSVAQAAASPTPDPWGAGSQASGSQAAGPSYQAPHCATPTRYHPDNLQDSHNLAALNQTGLDQTHMSQSHTQQWPLSQIFEQLPFPSDIDNLIQSLDKSEPSLDQLIDWNREHDRIQEEYRRCEESQHQSFGSLGPHHEDESGPFYEETFANQNAGYQHQIPTQGFDQAPAHQTAAHQEPSYQGFTWQGAAAQAVSQAPPMMHTDASQMTGDFTQQPPAQQASSQWPQAQLQQAPRSLQQAGYSSHAAPPAGDLMIDPALHSVEAMPPGAYQHHQHQQQQQDTNNFNVGAHDPANNNPADLVPEPEGMDYELSGEGDSYEDGSLFRSPETEES